MRWRYFWPLLAVNVAVDVEIVAHTLLPTPAAIGGLIGIFAGSVAVWSLPHWWAHPGSHDSRSGAVWWTLRHPRRRLWMRRHGTALVAQYEAEKRAEWHSVKARAWSVEAQRPPLPAPGAMDAIPRATQPIKGFSSRVACWNVMENYARADGFFDMGEKWINHRVRIHVPSSAGVGWKVLDGSVGGVWGVTRNLQGELMLRVLWADHTSSDLPVAYCTRVD